MLAFKNCGATSSNRPLACVPSCTWIGGQYTITVTQQLHKLKKLKNLYYFSSKATGWFHIWHVSSGIICYVYLYTWWQVSFVSKNDNSIELIMYSACWQKFSCCCIFFITCLAFIKNETLLLIRLKVHFSSSLFFAIRVKKFQCTFSSRLNSFAMNSNKVLIDFYSQFCSFRTLVAVSKKKIAYSIIRASFLTLTNQSTSKKTRVPLNQSEIVFYKN